MSLRTRLTLLYAGILAAVFIGLGLGAEVVMQGRFSDQTRSSLTSAVSYASGQATCIGCNGSASAYVRYALPPRAKQTPFENVYLELVEDSGSKYQAYDTSANLGSGHLMLDPAAIHLAFSRRQSTFLTRAEGGSELEFYYVPMPNPKDVRILPAVMVAAKSVSDVSRALDVFNAAFFSAEAVIWLLAVIVTWLVSGSALRPIKAMTQRAANIAETSDFSGRVPIDTRTAELQTLASTFNRMLESLQAAYANQQRFLADASHELRTPLTVLQGNLHYLDEAPDAPAEERDEALHAARLEADRMGGLVSDLLALSQADAGYGIQRERVELDRIVIDAFRRIQRRERGRRPGQQLQMRLGRLDEVVVDGDENRLLQLVVILVDNAVKYTPDAGTVEIELFSNGNDTATICVSDTGIGIAPEDREHVFERFYRAKDSPGKTEGSGLGLAIAKWIVDAHGGSIGFESHDGGGTRFVVELPARAARPAIAWD